MPNIYPIAYRYHAAEAIAEMNLPRITVLRLGHRPSRDKRISTHLLLAARAFGASEAIYTGVHDESLEESVTDVARDWGGSFKVKYADSYRKIIKEWSGKIIHLTMYGLPAQNVVPAIREDSSPKLIVVGGAKVPADVYTYAHWNVAITGQPHSEVSALAIFLNMLTEESMLSYEFPDARLRVIPTERGKNVTHIEKES